jgi:hypothetical protein
LGSADEDEFGRLVEHWDLAVLLEVAGARRNRKATTIPLVANRF